MIKPIAKRLSRMTKNKIKHHIKNCSGKTVIIGSVTGLNNQSSLLKNSSWNFIKNVSKPIAITNQSPQSSSYCSIPISKLNGIAIDCHTLKKLRVFFSVRIFIPKQIIIAVIINELRSHKFSQINSC